MIATANIIAHPSAAAGLVRQPKRRGRLPRCVIRIEDLRAARDARKWRQQKLIELSSRLGHCRCLRATHQQEGNEKLSSTFHEMAAEIAAEITRLSGLDMTASQLTIKKA